LLSRAHDHTHESALAASRAHRHLEEWLRLGDRQPSPEFVAELRQSLAEVQDAAELLRVYLLRVDRQMASVNACMVRLNIVLGTLHGLRTHYDLHCHPAEPHSAHNGVYPALEDTSGADEDEEPRNR
jgi:hypothetical protein